MLMWIILSSTFIAVFLLIRALFSKKINAVSMYVLWMLVAVRLLIPTYIPVEFNFFAAQNIPSITHQVESVEDSVSDFFTAQESTDKTEVDTLIPAAPADTMVQDGTENQDTTVQTNHGTTNVVVEPNVQTSNLTKHPFLFVWIIGIFGFGCYFIITNIRFSMRLKRSRIPLNDYDCKLPVYLVKWLPAPCMTGLIRPAIYVNEQIYDIENPHYVIEHEYMHYRHKDMIWMLMQNILLCIHWFNPLVWIASYLFRKDCEYACDEAVAKQLNAEERIAYGRTLLFFEVSKTKPFVFSTATSMSMDRKTMKRRVHLIVDQVPKRILSVVIVCVLAVVLFAGSMIVNTSSIYTNDSDKYWNKTYQLENSGYYHCFFPDGTLEIIQFGNYSFGEKNGETILVLDYNSGSETTKRTTNIVLTESSTGNILMTDEFYYFMDESTLPEELDFSVDDWTYEYELINGTDGLYSNSPNFTGEYQRADLNPKKEADLTMGYRFNLDGTFVEYTSRSYEVRTNHEIIIGGVTYQYLLEEEGTLLSLTSKKGEGTLRCIYIGSTEKNSQTDDVIIDSSESDSPRLNIEISDLTKDVWSQKDILGAMSLVVSEFQQESEWKQCELKQIRYNEQKTYVYHTSGKQIIVLDVNFTTDAFAAEDGHNPNSEYTYQFELQPADDGWEIIPVGQ